MTTSSLPHDDAISLNLVPGYIRQFGIGYNPDVDVSTTPEDCWGSSGLFPWITTPTNLEIHSTSAEDSISGTGARTAVFNLLNSGFNQISYVTPLNGTTAVQVPFACSGTNGARNLICGSNNKNVGDIIIRDSGGGQIRGIILAGQGVMKQSPYTVPAGYSLVVKQLFISIKPQSKTAHEYASMTTFFKGFGLGEIIPLTIGTTSAAPYHHLISPPINIAERTFFSLPIIETSDDNLIISNGWNGYIKSNK